MRVTEAPVSPVQVISMSRQHGHLLEGGGGGCPRHGRGRAGSSRGVDGNGDVMSWDHAQPQAKRSSTGEGSYVCVYVCEGV